MGKFKHGLAIRGDPHPDFRLWCGMRARCENPNLPSFKYYGGRGIAVCERWQDFATFVSDMGPRPSPDHSIERVNNDLGYGPENCVWATKKTQARNRRAAPTMTACRQGHPFSDENTYHRPDGKRGCRICRKEGMARFYARKKQNG